MQSVEIVTIEGQEVFSNVIGYADLDLRRLMVCGIVARRSAMDYVLPTLHAGKNVLFNERILYSLGAKRYVGKKGSLSDGVQCVLVIPNPVRVENSDEEDKDVEQIKTVIWHSSEATQTHRIWSTLMHNTPIPLRNTWQEPILEVLGNAAQIDQWRSHQGLTERNIERITPMQFPVGGDEWSGVVLRVDDDDIAIAAQALLRQGKITF